MKASSKSNPANAELAPILFSNPFLSKEILAKVNLGSPSKNCLGVGICKIDLLLSIQQKDFSSSSCSTIASIKKNRDGRLTFRFRKDNLPARIIETHFHGHTFLVEERYVLPTALVRSLQCQSIIQQGIYKVEECSEFLCVDF